MNQTTPPTPPRTTEQPGAVKADCSDAPTVAQARQVIADYISPFEVIGDPAWDAENKEWRATFALKPTGPLVLGAFKLRANNITLADGASERGTTG